MLRQKSRKAQKQKLIEEIGALFFTINVLSIFMPAFEKILELERLR